MRFNESFVFIRKRVDIQQILYAHIECSTIR